MRAAALLGALALLVGCTTTRAVDPAGLELYEVVRNEPLRAWRVTSDDTTLGWVVEFGDPGAPARAERTSFSVRNPWHQELGTVDGLGRAWRFVPHQPEAEWIATGTLLDGARAILATASEAVLQEVPLATLGARPASRE